MGKSPVPTTKAFVYLLSGVQAVVLVGFFFLAKPTTMHYEDKAQNTQLYNYYVGVSLMMLVGFGYLMTFLRWYGLGAVGLTMLVTCLGVQVAMLVEPMFSVPDVIFAPASFNVDLMALLNGNFAVAAFLISFGGLIGKVNPSQLVILVVLETIFYSINHQAVLVKWLDIKDCGGTIVIHMFGAYFGLTVAAVLGKPANLKKETNSTTSDLFSLIGTVFLWLYWPSFVGGAIPAGTIESETALTNTVLALLGSTVVAFITSALLSGNMLRPVDIQNATLAGGVSIGSVANLNISPFGALLIGCAAGKLSTFGFARVQDILAEKGLHDSCGIHNLHGMPSLLGGLASVLVPLIVKPGDAGELGLPKSQLLGVVCTIGFAVASGALTGTVMKIFKDDSDGMDDGAYWEVADDFSKDHA